MKSKNSIFLILLTMSSNYIYGIDWPKVATGYIAQDQCLTTFPNGKFIDQYIDPSARQIGTFPLFFFSAHPFDPSLKSLIYLDGGPGQISGTSINTLRFVDEKKFNIVYFHPRGAGCSQLPLDNTYDQYIRLKNDVEDIEAIRLALGIGKWDILFGVSAGTTVALDFAEKYSDHVDKLVLEGLFNPGFDSGSPVVRIFNYGIPTLVKLLEDWPELKDLDDQAVVHVYTQLQNLQNGKPMKDINGKVLSAANFNNFFAAAMPLIYYGVNQRENFNKAAAIAQVKKLLGYLLNKSDIDKIVDVPFNTSNKLNYISLRAFYVHMIYDGINLDFINGLKASTPTLAIKNFAGNYAGFIGLAPDLTPKVKPLPAVPSSISVLVLQGSSDGVCPVKGALELLQELKAESALYTLNDFGHQRNFSDACYGTLFGSFLTGQRLDDFFKDQSHACFLPSGYTVETAVKNPRP